MKSVRVSLRNSCLKSKTGGGIFEIKGYRHVQDDDLDLLGDEDMESFSGSHADLEGAAEQLFASPRPQPLRFEALSLKTPAKTVPPSPGTALQQKIESNLEKSLGSQFNIQLQQQMVPSRLLCLKQ